MTWTELVMGMTSVRGDQPAVSDVRTGEVLSYASFARRVTHAAAGLRRFGLRYGDRVLVDLPLGAGLTVAVHAVAWAGGTAVLGATGTALMMITQGPLTREAVDVQNVFTFEPTPGAIQFADLIGGRTVEFGPLAGPALSLDGDRVLDHDELASDLRRLASRLLISKDDVVLAAVSEPFKGLRVADLAMMAGAQVVIAHEPTLIGARVLASEHAATLVVAPYELAKKLLGDPVLRVVDERAIVSSLGL
ncbi:AMP-binding protein [Nonomuraea sp. NPDC005983]|uniref:AMP-binding protein n=1 Tax=Nonomuraea sp. NPDC005983 TaxID=3155595 RepID=UPI0033BF96F6